jgi:glycine/D-amino acid oxidase-like deaminating enzyme
MPVAQSCITYLILFYFRVVILGAGIVGTSTAHYLGELGAGSQTAVVERCGVASAASGKMGARTSEICLVAFWRSLNSITYERFFAGKAGGFLALDWSEGSHLSPLARASFKLHQELATKFGAENIGYRPVRTLSVRREENLYFLKSSIKGRLNASLFCY